MKDAGTNTGVQPTKGMASFVHTTNMHVHERSVDRELLVCNP